MRAGANRLCQGRGEGAGGGLPAAGADSPKVHVVWWQAINTDAEREQESAWWSDESAASGITISTTGTKGYYYMHPRAYNLL